MLERNENIIYSKVEAFTDRIVKMVRYLKKKKADAAMIDQVNRSGLSIGANANEAKFAQSRADFVSKMSIALKEANETKYWLRKLLSANSLSQIEFDSIYKDSDEIVALLHCIVHTCKINGTQ